MTKKEMFMEIRKVVSENPKMVAFIDHEIELLSKKSSSSRKPTKKQLENAEFKNSIVEYLTTADRLMTIREMQAEIPGLADLTNQRITHMLTDLIEAKKLTREYIKKVPYFSVKAE